MCVYVLFSSLTYIALQPLGVFDLSLTSPTACRGWFELHCVCNTVYVGDVEDITK